MQTTKKIFKLAAYSSLLLIYTLLSGAISYILQFHTKKDAGPIAKNSPTLNSLVGVNLAEADTGGPSPSPSPSASSSCGSGTGSACDGNDGGPDPSPSPSPDPGP